MKSLSTAIDDKTQIGFNEDGTVKDTELNILNLDQTSQWQVVRKQSNTYPSNRSRQLVTKKENTAICVAHFFLSKGEEETVRRLRPAATRESLIGRPVPRDSGGV